MDEYVYSKLIFHLADDFIVAWIPFLVAALLQGCLLIMCITWKVHQRKLGIDDFGNPVHPEFPPLSWSEQVPRSEPVDVVTEPQRQSPAV